MDVDMIFCILKLFQKWKLKYTNQPWKLRILGPNIFKSNKTEAA